MSPPLAISIIYNFFFHISPQVADFIKVASEATQLAKCSICKFLSHKPMVIHLHGDSKTNIGFASLQLHFPLIPFVTYFVSIITH